MGLRRKVHIYSINDLNMRTRGCVVYVYFIIIYNKKPKNLTDEAIDRCRVPKRLVIVVPGNAFDLITQ